MILIHITHNLLLRLQGRRSPGVSQAWTATNGTGLLWTQEENRIKDVTASGNKILLCGDIYFGDRLDIIKWNKVYWTLNVIYLLSRKISVKRFLTWYNTQGTLHLCSCSFISPCFVKYLIQCEEVWRRSTSRKKFDVILIKWNFCAVDFLFREWIYN